MYGRVVGAGTTGAGGATLAATGVWMNSKIGRAHV